MKWQRVAEFFIPDIQDVSWREKIYATGTAFIGMFTVAWISHKAGGDAGLLFMAASMGSAAVLLFASPHAPQSQPWALIGGHIVSAFIGVLCVQLFNDVVLAASTAVAFSVLAMFILRCMHPPGGAAALAAVVGGPEITGLGYWYILSPVAMNVLVVLVMALIINNILPGRRYPVMPDKDASKDGFMKEAFGYMALTDQDIDASLEELDVFIDVDRQDLQRIYSGAMLKNYHRRLGHVYCRDIMVLNPVSFVADTPLDVTWHALSEQDIKTAPITDAQGRVLGCVTMAGLMKYATLSTSSDQTLSGTVSMVMESPAIMINQKQHIVDAIPVFNEQQLNTLIVVDDAGCLRGVLTQADLMRALLVVRA